MLLRINQSGHRTWHADGFIPDPACIWHHVSLGIKIHVTAGCLGSFFAEVEKVKLSIGFAQQHETAAADIACRRMDYSESKSSGHGCIHGVAALAQDVRANL